jgi:hypothetical protein
MDIQLNQCIVQDLHQVFSGITGTTLVAVSLGILDYIAQAKTSTMPTVNNNIRGLILVGRVVLVVCFINILLQLLD